MADMVPLTDAEKSDVRRHCGYPIQAIAGTGGQSWFLYQQLGQMESRMNRLNDQELRITRTYLATLLNLELAVPRSGDSLDTDQAAVWTRNRTEQQDHLALFDEWRRRLCAFLGIQPGPYFPDKTNWVVV